MPKKKEKKSVEKQNDVQKTQKSDSPAAAEGTEKYLYLTQKRYLNEQLQRYQLKCEALERQKKDLDCQCVILEKEKKDVVEYLKRSLLEKEAEVDELTERLEGQQRAAQQHGDSQQLTLTELRRELQGRVTDASSENKSLESRLSALQEFQEQREQIMSSMESLEKQLANQKEEHKATVHSLEMKALLEKKRLEKEMESHVAVMAAEVQQLVEQKVPEAARSALQENVEVRSLISQLSEQNHDLMEENFALRDRKGRLRVEVENLEEMLRETSRQSCVHKKVVEQLTEKCQQLQAELKDCQQEQEVEQLHTKQTGVLGEMEALRDLTLNQAQTFQFELALQNPAGPGLVPPPPTRKHKHTPSRRGAAGSSSPQGPLLRKPSSQKTDRSINLSASAAAPLTSRNPTTKPK
ncbi:cilia- and flagella-associated protein 157 [Gymnodraco acuticeps]|uniref:Cilia- and flagella-associated protein 157 n=1 Tax=Gymnodraco acuticeps TaxID=8218 RepID=A0A6P8U172_GYMAC|nr:cilia- and flagella-associated protein 157 [Gymnodraco acuticeps]